MQTLFYGVFSAWVLWSRSAKSGDGPLFAGGYGATRFNWREAVWHLRAPVLRAYSSNSPTRVACNRSAWLRCWTGRRPRLTGGPACFFARFNEGEAVPYFYEPFLEAFDPELRKQLGVWYTPVEVVRYMVARVDKALKDDLDIPDGLASETSMCSTRAAGTGAYLAEYCAASWPI